MRTVLLTGITLGLCCSLARADDWDSNKIWHDGLVEKAVYSASRVVYGKPRSYEAIFFTNKELHDRKTLTKADKSTDIIEVWKFNQIEDIPTPNYTYHYVTTSHLTTDKLELTRLDSSSQEFCGTTFKQVMRIGSQSWEYWSFSYMPEAGRNQAKFGDSDRTVVAENALPLYLRSYNFNRGETRLIGLLPDQRSNRPTPNKPINALMRCVGQDLDNWKIEVAAEDATTIGGIVRGTYWMAKDRGHVMTRYLSGDGEQTYQLKSIERVNYWTIKGE